MKKDAVKPGKVLVVYFSHSGNTRVVAGQVKDITGGDVFEIAAAEAYPGDYDATVARAVKELKAKARPSLKSKTPDLSAYTTIILGYPNWCNTIPMPVAAFLSVNDLSGKNIAPFCTNEGSGLGRSESDIKALCPQSKVLNGLALRGSTVKKSCPEMARWLKELGLGST